MKLTVACLLVAALGLVPTASSAQQHRGTPDEQEACTPDVYRLCSQEIPDEDDIVACLQRKKAQLSPACGAVFSRPDTGTKGTTPASPPEETDD